MTGQEALAVLDAAIVEQERARWVHARRVRDEAAQVAREALARWSQAEKERRK
jgi:hypothetical protein